MTGSNERGRLRRCGDDCPQHPVDRGANRPRLMTTRVRWLTDVDASDEEVPSVA